MLLTVNPSDQSPFSFVLGFKIHLMKCTDVKETYGTYAVLAYPISHTQHAKSVWNHWLFVTTLHIQTAWQC